MGETEIKEELKDAQNLTFKKRHLLWLFILFCLIVFAILILVAFLLNTYKTDNNRLSFEDSFISKQETDTKDYYQPELNKITDSDIEYLSGYSSFIKDEDDNKYSCVGSKETFIEKLKNYYDIEITGGYIINDLDGFIYTYVSQDILDDQNSYDTYLFNDKKNLFIKSFDCRYLEYFIYPNNETSEEQILFKVVSPADTSEWESFSKIDLLRELRVIPGFYDLTAEKLVDRNFEEKDNYITMIESVKTESICDNWECEGLNSDKVDTKEHVYRYYKDTGLMTVEY